MSTESNAPVVAAAAEAPAAPAPAAAPASDPGLDTRLAALSRKEREIQQAQAKLKQERASLVSRDELANLWKTDRAKLREYLGASEDEWKVPSPVQEKEDPVKSLQEQIAAMKQERESEKLNAQTQQFKQSLAEFVSNAPDEYELIAANGAHDTVFDFMVDYYREHQVELEFKDACDYVENYLFEQSKKVASTKKIGALFQTKPESGKQPSPTLTGTAAANPTSTTQRKLSPEESLAEAAKLIKWN